MDKNNWIDELKAKLEKNKVIVGTCWLYKGKAGRQWIGFNYKTYLVHRVSACVYLGFNLEDWHLICHKQECPNPGCYNWEHIYIGDSSTNKLDEVALGKYKNQNTVKTVCGTCGQPYDGQVKRRGGKVWRFCRKCKVKRSSYG